MTLQQIEQVKKKHPYYFDSMEIELSWMHERIRTGVAESAGYRAMLAASWAFKLFPELR